MNKFFNIVISLSLFVLSCSNKQEINLFREGGLNKTIEILNNSADPMQFDILVDDANLFSNFGLFKAAGGNIFAHKSIEHIKEIFNFVCISTYHKDYKHSSNILYNPSVAISSIGGGLCSLRSGVLTNLLRMNGYKAVSYVLSGHVITLVNYNGRNLVFDPDLGLWYYNAQGLIASYEELCNNPEFITKPVNPVLDKSNPDFFSAYSPETANLYSSISDNYILNTGYSSENNGLKDFILPSSAQMSIPVIPAINPNRSAYAVIKLPIGVTGVVSTPFILASVVGNCLVKFNSNRICVDDEYFFEENNLIYGNINILENKEGIVLYFFVNPCFFSAVSQTKISICSNTINSSNVSVVLGKSTNTYPCEKDVLDMQLKINLLRAMELTGNYSLDKTFSSFIDNCKNDTIINRYFFWDSIQSDYNKLLLTNKFISSYSSLELIHPEIVRRFFASRFILKKHFTD